MTSTQKTIQVSDNGQLEIAITIQSYNSGTQAFQVLVEGRIRNTGKSRVFHSTANITASITGLSNFTGANFNFDLSSGEVLTFISHTFNITQNTAGNSGMAFAVHYGVTGTTAFGDNKDVDTSLAVRPGIPGPPQYSNILPTSVTVSWDPSPTTGGAAISYYKLRRWDSGVPGHGNFIDYNSPTLVRNITGLRPGTTYGFAVYANNSTDDNQGFSDPSTGTTVQTVGGVWVRSAGHWKVAIPYVRTGGTWKLALPFVRSGGHWKQTN
jgi:hypothetical protein